MKKISRKGLVKVLDTLCRTLVFKRDGNRCRRCDKTSHLQWAHIYSRRYHSVRWEPTNSLVLCAGCHMWGHHNPTEFSDWIAFELGPERLAELNLWRHTRTKQDLQGLRLWLTAEIAK